MAYTKKGGEALLICVSSLLKLVVIVGGVTFLKQFWSGWPITKHWSSQPIRAHCAVRKEGLYRDRN